MASASGGQLDDVRRQEITLDAMGLWNKWCFESNTRSRLPKL